MIRSDGNSDSPHTPPPAIAQGIRATLLSVVINSILAVLKIITGLFGNSYALIADGIESTADILTSLIVWGSLRIAAIPPDTNHPYGHGRAESLAAVVVSIALVGAAIVIAIHSIREILTPHVAPKWYTLLVLSIVILVKEVWFRVLFRRGNLLGSNAIKGDALHHRADALTSLAAFVGISIALAGGPGYESADDWAALVASGVMIFNASRILKESVSDFMDEVVSHPFENELREIACSVPGVDYIEKCRIRKSGLAYIMEIHVMVDDSLSVREGHEIAHQVKDALLASPYKILEVIAHVEPSSMKPVS